MSATIFNYFSVPFHNIVLGKFKINYLGYSWLWVFLKHRETSNEVKFHAVTDPVVNEATV